MVSYITVVQKSLKISLYEECDITFVPFSLLSENRIRLCHLRRGPKFPISLYNVQGIRLVTYQSINEEGYINDNLYLL